MGDTLQELFGKCTDDLQNPHDPDDLQNPHDPDNFDNVYGIMNTFKRHGLAEIQNRTNLALFKQLEPIIRIASGSIAHLIRAGVVTENDTDVVKARRHITDISTYIWNEVNRIREEEERRESLLAQEHAKVDMSTLLMKLKELAVFHTIQ
jgi:hypothetical protein